MKVIAKGVSYGVAACVYFVWGAALVAAVVCYEVGEMRRKWAA